MYQPCLHPRALEAMTLDGRAAAAVPKKRAEPKNGAGPKSAAKPKAAPKQAPNEAPAPAAPATRRKGKQAE